MIKKKPTQKKSKAQAMVEFAIALPLLLLLLYGILEAGRLLFLYSTVVTASRQAVRYGAATGTGNGAEPRYQDCDGIRAAANKAGFLGAFDTISISYDNGPSTASQPFCVNVAATSDSSPFPLFPRSDNTSRLSVTVSEQFVPIVPQIVPFGTRTITATSARTVLVGVSIQVTSPPVIVIPNTPTNTATATYTPTTTYTPSSTATTTLTPALSYTPSNTPTITLIPTITLTPTVTLTPTPIATPVPSCAGITHGPITKSGNTMSMTITNPWNFPLITGAGTVTWNDDKGHQTGGDKTLRLQNITIAGTTVWTGNSNNVSTMAFSDPAVIPPNSTVTIILTFHQSYDNFDGTENIYINLSTPGCEGNPIQS
jgi:Flp pilus assembly protein TadG